MQPSTASNGHWRAWVLILVLLMVETGNAWEFKAMNAEDFFTGITLDLVQAAARGDANAVATLAKAGADPNAIGRDDMSPLVWTAFFAKNKEGTRALLRVGGNPNLKFRRDMTPMLLAVKEKDVDFLRLFLDEGGDPNIAISDSSLLFIAADNDNWAHMWLLIEHGADFNFKDSVNGTLLYELALTSDYEQVFYLLERGADFTVKTSTGDSVIEWIYSEAVHPQSDAYPWQQKCRAWLEARGINKPLRKEKSPEELNKFLNDIWESSKKNKKNAP